MIATRLLSGTGSGLQVCSDFFCLHMKQLFIAIIAISLLIACNDRSGNRSEVSTNTSIQSAQRKEDSLQKVINDSIQFSFRKDSILLSATQNVLTALKNKNYSAFANHIHPEEGIRFSPYGYIDTNRHIKFSRSAFIDLVNKTDQSLIWGEFDGTGDPIKMTLNNYMQRFVYDVDFIKPENFKVNDFIGFGNSLNNLSLVYKDCDFTESHFSGFDEKYGGMDWRSLRLVFKERNKRFYLVGVVHDEWTI